MTRVALGLPPVLLDRIRARDDLDKAAEVAHLPRRAQRLGELGSLDAHTREAFLLAPHQHADRGLRVRNGKRPPVLDGRHQTRLDDALQVALRMRAGAAHASCELIQCELRLVNQRGVQLILAFGEAESFEHVNPPSGIGNFMPLALSALVNPCTLRKD